MVGSGSKQRTLSPRWNLNFIPREVICSSWRKGEEPRPLPRGGAADGPAPPRPRLLRRGRAAGTELGCSARVPLPSVGERRSAPGSAGTGRPPVPARARPAGHAGCAARDAGAGGGRGGGGGVGDASRRAEGQPPALGRGSPSRGESSRLWRRCPGAVGAGACAGPVPASGAGCGLGLSAPREQQLPFSLLLLPLDISRHSHSSSSFPCSLLS